MKSRLGRNLHLPLGAGTAMFMVAALTLGVQSTSQGAPAAPTPGKACKTKGQRLPGGFVCVKKNGKLVWAVTTATTTPTPSPTTTTATGANSGSPGFTTALGFAPWSPTSSNALFSSGSQPVGSQISTSRAAVHSGTQVRRSRSTAPAI